MKQARGSYQFKTFSIIYGLENAFSGSKIQVLVLKGLIPFSSGDIFLHKSVKIVFQIMPILLGVALGLVSFSSPVLADTLELLLMPGEVLQGHEKWEADCAKCHKLFDKSAQDGLCRDCHKDISRDIQEKHRFHGRMKNPGFCRECHAEHEGRTAQIALLDENTFDHSKTDFLLRGAHGDPKLNCRSCHKAGVKYRKAPDFCRDCHIEDDVHKGKLGFTCADCHNETDWKEVRFDHDTQSRFPLKAKHADVTCTDCHADQRFKPTPVDCYACHKQDDKHKEYFGPSCQDCHNEQDWKIIIFDHGRDTKFVLRGKHQPAKCESCHTAPIYEQNIGVTCMTCHRNDDVHKTHFGEKCQICHTEDDWKDVTFDHDRDTKFVLRGKHQPAKCESCHIGKMYEVKLESTCMACHRSDDPHKGQEGEKCEECHNEEDWKDVMFDHGLARFPLLGKHLIAKCEDCHETMALKDVALTCVGCHKKEDVHEQRLGPKCEMCHNSRDWKLWDFDHNRLTSFLLDGAHDGLECAACHMEPMQVEVVVIDTCVGCHNQDDVHEGDFGSDCQRCHKTSVWDALKPKAQFSR